MFGAEGEVIPYVLGVDVWEGSLEIDEQVLRDGGVRYVITRLNDMNGGHHRDQGFDKQWAESARFVRWPYFVYNPWVKGKNNFEWMADNMPSEATFVSLDIEVVYEGYSALEYANQVEDFIARVGQYWKLDIYTGGWFLPLLSRWPKDVYYWWARYLTRFYPAQTEHLSWTELHERIRVTSFNPGTAVPGPCKNWQIGGDRMILPGTVRPIDICVFNGSEEDLGTYAGAKPSARSWAVQVDAWARTMGYAGVGPEG